MNYFELHKEFKENSLFGRYITLNAIEPLLKKHSISVEGYSVLNNPIYSYKIGNGKIKVFMWSQMHGNEGTTTKALFDFFNFLHSSNTLAKAFLQHFTFCFLPMVNPDGAKLYTRENANQIDLNRDAANLSEPESKILRLVFNDFKPDFCYNLHDQRTIFGVDSKTGIQPATVSFLAPAFNENREVNETRLKAMNVIVAMNNELQQHIPNQVGRFDDSFNFNCIGDSFTMFGVPTILFEAGHFQNDYYREFTRKMIFIALISGLKHIYENDVVVKELDDYLNIPQNKVAFFDFIYKNVKINYENKEIITNFAAQYKEELIDGEIHFIAYIAEIGSLDGKSAHYLYNAHKMMYSDNDLNYPKINQKADFYLEKNIKFVNGVKK